MKNNTNIPELMHNAVLILSEKGRIEYSNKSAQSLFNIKASAKRAVFSLLKAEDKRLFKNNIRQLIESHRNREFESCCTVKNKEKHIYWSISLMPEQDRIRILCVGTDISKHSRIDVKREAKREALQKCLDENMNKLYQTNMELRNEIKERKSYENELHQKIRFNKLINSITNRFLNMNPENVHDGSIGILKKIADFGQFDMAGLIGRSFIRDAMLWQVYYADKNVKLSRIMPMKGLKHIEKMLLEKGIINIPDFNEADESLIKECRIVAGRKVRSIIITPLIYRKKLVAMLVFINFRKKHIMTDILKEELFFITRMLINFIDYKVIHRELLRSQKKYRIVTKQTGHIVYDYNVRWKRTEWSGAIREVTGFRESEFPEYYNTHFDDIIHPDDLVFVKQHIKDVLGNPRKYKIQYRMKNKKNQFRYILDEGTVTKDSKGKPSHMIGTIKDISDRIEYEQQIKNSEERYRNFVRNSNEGIWRITFNKPLKIKYSHKRQFDIYMKQSYVAECNDVCAKMYGYDKAEELVGKPLFELLGNPKIKAPKVWKFAEMQYKAANTTSREFDKYGNEKYFLNNSVGIIKDGEVRSVWGTQQDITERIHAERELKENQRKLTVLMSNLPGMVYRRKLDEKFTMEFASDGVYDVTGYSVDEMKNSVDLFGIIHPKDKNEVIKKIVNAIGADEQYRFSYRIIDRDGNRRWVWEQGRSVSNRVGDPIAIEGFITDITDQKLAEITSDIQQKQLMQADKMSTLGTLVSGVAHEINNPNNFIMLNGKIIRRVWNDIQGILENYYKKKGDFLIAGLPYSEAKGKMPKLINGIIEGTDRIKAIVSNLKDFSKTDSGEMRRDIDINIAIESAVMIVRNLIKKNTDYFTVELDDQLPKIVANKQQIEQVIINLLTNACDALTSKNNAISVKSGTEDGKLFIKVIDEGEGVSDNYIKHIFDPFFTTKRDEGGTGLGLSISYNIIKEHGGEIVFDSGETMGTTVTVYLPLKEDEQ